MPIVILPPIIAVAAIVFYFIKRKTKKKFEGKKIMLFGPPQSGKTTFVNWLTQKTLTKEYVATGTGDYHSYHDDDYNVNYDFFDMGGSSALLKGGEFENKYKDNDIILVFFNSSYYLHNTDNYQKRVNTLFDSLFVLEGEKKPTLFVGTFRDKLSETEQKQFGENLVKIIDENKPYYRFVCNQKFFLVDMRERSMVSKILEEINKLKM